MIKKKKKKKDERTKESEGEFFSKQANGEMVFHLNLMTLQSSLVVNRHYILNSQH